ncbi:ketoacyl-synt-domain-containing protein [Testicularia cyperi]|uniref:Ketoacyl-synt-domain-containing protein n=1 Tax=Testicularia cyperi TaxID=1882483 RepID=A0A317XLX9_9BASI|nr:ketoacyl-synt-domain-containing protein [Testicularia cyperi]
MSSSALPLRQGVRALSTSCSRLSAVSASRSAPAGQIASSVASSNNSSVSAADRKRTKRLRKQKDLVLRKAVEMYHLTPYFLPTPQRAALTTGADASSSGTSASARGGASWESTLDNTIYSSILNTDSVSRRSPNLIPRGLTEYARDQSARASSVPAFGNTDEDTSRRAKEADSFASDLTSTTFITRREREAVAASASASPSSTSSASKRSKASKGMGSTQTGEAALQHFTDEDIAMYQRRHNQGASASSAGIDNGRYSGAERLTHLDRTTPGSTEWYRSQGLDTRSARVRDAIFGTVNGELPGLEVGSDFLRGFEPIFILSRQHPPLHAFITLALQAVRSDLQSVANRRRFSRSPVSADEEIDLLPYLPPLHAFSDLRTLVRHHAVDQLRDPVVNGVLLCLLQTASIVAVHCASLTGKDSPKSGAVVHLQGTWTVLCQRDVHLLGLCTGGLSAWAAAGTVLDPAADASPNAIWRFMYSAVTALRMSLWIGLRSKQARSGLTKAGVSALETDQRWSAVVIGSSPDLAAQVEGVVRTFNNTIQDRCAAATSRIGITAFAFNQVSVGGPPGLLRVFMQHINSTDCAVPGLRASELEIFSPYHSADLEAEVRAVMLDLELRGVLSSAHLPSQGNKHLWDISRAAVMNINNDVHTWARQLVESNLARPARWDSTVISLIESIAGDDQTYSSIVSLGPGMGLATDIKRRMSGRSSTGHDDSVSRFFDIPSLLREWALQTDAIQLERPIRSLVDPHVEGDEVVIVSMACRFPGEVRTPEQLWTCLETGRTTVSEIPKHLFDVDLYAGDGQNQTRARHMHALSEDITATMDARLFSMSPKEIEQLDPQHRLVMLCSYEALERAGYSPDANSPSSFDRKRIAVCMGASWDDYRENASHNIGSYFITGNIRAFLPGHISFSLKWEGPSISLDTRECTGISAIEWSRRALLSNQCDVALAGAVCVITQPQMFIAMDKDGHLSTTGTNATFSHRHDGMTRGDGCGVLLLKRRSTAVRDGDKILACIPAVAMRSHSTTFASSASAVEQTDFIMSKLFASSSSSLESLVHIEASGYYSQEAEAIEIEGLHRLLAMRSATRIRNNGEDTVTVSSVRPNLGAGDAVAAMASVMKSVLMLQKKVVPRQLSIASEADLQTRIRDVCRKSSLVIPTEARMLPVLEVSKSQRCILVNSLASTGCQGAVLIEEVEAVGDSNATRLHDARGAWVFVLSAKTVEALEQQRKALLSYLYRDVCLADLSYSLCCRRTHHPFRLAVVASDQEELTRALKLAKVAEAVPVLEKSTVSLRISSSTASSTTVLDGLLQRDRALARCKELICSLSSSIDTSDNSLISVHQAALVTFLHTCGLKFDNFADTSHTTLLLTRTAPDNTQTKSFEALIAVDATQRQSSIVAGAGGGGPEQRASCLQVGETVDVIVSPSIKPCSVSGDSLLLYRRLLDALVALHLSGHTLRWIEMHRPYLFELNMLSDLPTYPFSLQRYWMHYQDRGLISRKLKSDSRPSDADQQEGLEERMDGSGLLEQARMVALGQVCLTDIAAKDADGILYRSSLAEEPQRALLLADSPVPVWAALCELMVQARTETSNQAGTPQDPLTDEVVVIEHLRLLKPMFRPSSNISAIYLRAHSVSPLIEALPDSEPLDSVASCYVRRSPHDEFSNNWNTMQSLLKDRLHRISSDGERFGARLFYRAVEQASLRPCGKSSRIAQHAHILPDNGAALVSCTLHTGDELAGAHLYLPLCLLLAVEQCAFWFCSALAGDADQTFLALVGIRKILFSPTLRPPDGISAQKGLDCRVYVGKIDDRDAAEDPSRHFVLDMLILGRDNVIIGQLQGIEITQSSKDAASAKPNDASRTSTARAATGNHVTPAASLEQVHNQQPITSLPASDKAISPTRSTTYVAQPQFKGGNKAQAMYQQILETIAAELGLPISDLKPTARFADLGLDSLMSLVCISTLETLAMGLDIPQSLFLDCDCPAELLSWLQAQVSDETLDEPHAFEEAVAVENSAGATCERADQHEPAEAHDTTAATTGTSAGTALDEVMALVVSTVEMELGVESGSIRGDANLADLGMDSLMSLLVLGSLASTVSFELPPSLFLECPSLYDIRAFFAKCMGATEGDAPSGTVGEAGSSTPGEISSSWTLPETSPTLDLPPARKPVLLHAGTGTGIRPQIPLFLLPDGSGMSTVYQFLPAIDRPVYALNSPFLANAAEWDRGVEQIAQYYLSSVRLVQPQGPYLIGGWSFGGMAAFEVARMLSSSTDPGDAVCGLCLIHSPSPAKYPPLPMSIVDWIFTAPEIKDIAPPALSPKLVAQFKATVDNLATYRPTPITATSSLSSKLHAFYIVPDSPLPGKRADLQVDNSTVDWLFRPSVYNPDGWELLIPANVIEVLAVERANHFTIVREPAIAHVAADLRQACNKALKT